MLNFAFFVLAILDIILGIAAFTLGDKYPKWKLILGVLCLIILVPVSIVGSLSFIPDRKLLTSSQTKENPPASTQNPNLIHGEPVSPESLERIVGGDAAYWKQAGPVVWVYSNKNHNTTMQHPGENMVLTYWASFGDPQSGSDCRIIISPVNNLEKAVKCPFGTNAQIVADQVGLHIIDDTGFFP